MSRLFKYNVRHPGGVNSFQIPRQAINFMEKLFKRGVTNATMKIELRDDRKKKKRSKYWLEGAEAFKQGLSKDLANPHPENTTMYEAWNRGYDQTRMNHERATAKSGD